MEELNLKEGIDLVVRETLKKKDLKTRVMNANFHVFVLNPHFCFFLHQELERYREGVGIRCLAEVAAKPFSVKFQIDHNARIYMVVENPFRADAEIPHQAFKLQIGNVAMIIAFQLSCTTDHRTTFWPRIRTVESLTS
jgi:hypothetical protein